MIRFFSTLTIAIIPTSTTACSILMPGISDICAVSDGVYPKAEPVLIAAGYALEQGTQARVEPDLEATMKLIDALTE